MIALSFAWSDVFNTETSSSAHALGMGNAGVVAERGSHAIFYNPANLATNETRTNFQPINVQMDVTERSASNLMSGKSINLFDLQGGYNAALKSPGQPVGARFSAYPNFTSKYLSFGMLYELNQSAEVRGADGALRVKARNRFAPIAALSWRMFGGILRFGGSAQYETVGNANEWVSNPETANLDYSEYISAGAGFNFTGGVTLTFPFRYLPSFSFVARNIGNTNYTQTPMIDFGKKRDVPQKPMTFDVGSLWTVYLGKYLETRYAFEYRDLTHEFEPSSRMRRLNIGTEFILFDLIRLRAGMSRGYWTFGFGLQTRKGSLDFAAYADEKENMGLRSGKEQRYSLQYSWNLF